MTKLLVTILILLIVAVTGITGFALSGFYEVGADAPHGKVAGWLLSTASHASVERRAISIDVPDLTDSKLRLAGANDFNAMCADCHGAPGKKPKALGRGLNPRPPDLAVSAAHMTPAQLFWVTKHGIRMTGMPAWGATHDDDALWPVVAFMTALPELGADDYQALLAKAAGIGHHGSTGDMPASNRPPDAHDHSAHRHGTSVK
jgi:mono/diheme cytochrome c family protein